MSLRQLQEAAAKADVHRILSSNRASVPRMPAYIAGEHKVAEATQMARDSHIARVSATIARRVASEAPPTGAPAVSFETALERNIPKHPTTLLIPSSDEPVGSGQAEFAAAWHARRSSLVGDSASLLHEAMGKLPAREFSLLPSHGDFLSQRLVDLATLPTQDSDGRLALSLQPVFQQVSLPHDRALQAELGQDASRRRRSLVLDSVQIDNAAAHANVEPLLSIGLGAHARARGSDIRSSSVPRNQRSTLSLGLSALGADSTDSGMRHLLRHPGATSARCAALGLMSEDAVAENLRHCDPRIRQEGARVVAGVSSRNFWRTPRVEAGLGPSSPRAGGGAAASQRPLMSPLSPVLGTVGGLETTALSSTVSQPPAHVQPSRSPRKYRYHPEEGSKAQIAELLEEYNCPPPTHVPAAVATSPRPGDVSAHRRDSNSSAMLGLRVNARRSSDVVGLRCTSLDPAPLPERITQLHLEQLELPAHLSTSVPARDMAAAANDQLQTPFHSLAMTGLVVHAPMDPAIGQLLRKQRLRVYGVADYAPRRAASNANTGGNVKDPQSIGQSIGQGTKASLASLTTADNEELRSGTLPKKTSALRSTGTCIASPRKISDNSTAVSIRARPRQSPPPPSPRLPKGRGMFMSAGALADALDGVIAIASGLPANRAT